MDALDKPWSIIEEIIIKNAVEGEVFKLVSDKRSFQTGVLEALIIFRKIRRGEIEPLITKE